MNRKLSLGLFTVLVATLTAGMCLAGCDMHKGSESQLKETADSFAVHYYNWRFGKAVHYCTPESEQWLRFAATNVHSADIDSLRAMAADAEIRLGDVEFDENDTTATAIFHVKDFLQMDSLGQAAKVHKEATFRIPMVIRGEEWLVKLNGLPRAEK